MNQVFDFYLNVLIYLQLYDDNVNHQYRQHERNCFQ